jgi:hypothetical protein
LKFENFEIEKRKTADTLQATQAPDTVGDRASVY